MYTTVQVSHSLSTRGWPHWAHLQSFLSAPTGPSVEQSFSNLEQILDSLPKPHHQLVVKEWTERDFMQKCCLPLHFLPSTAADTTLPSNGVVACRSEARDRVLLASHFACGQSKALKSRYRCNLDGFSTCFLLCSGKSHSAHSLPD